MGDFVELIIFLAVVFFSLLAGGSKKKKQQGQQQRRQLPQRQPQQPVEQPVQRRVPPRSEPAREALAEPTGPGERHNLAQQIFDMLSEQLPEVTRAEASPPEPPQPVTLEEVDVQPQSLESLEPDRAASHERFHERYVEDSKPARVLRREGRFSPANAREAVIWKAIFSPPKGME